MDTKTKIKGSIPIHVIDWDGLLDTGYAATADKQKKSGKATRHIGDMPIERLIISNHLFNLFCRYGLKTVSDILAFSDEEWREKGGIGVKSWPELKKLLDLTRAYVGKDLTKEMPKAQVWQSMVAFNTPLLQMKSLNDQISRQLHKAGIDTLDDVFHCHPKDWQNLKGVNRWRKKDYLEETSAFREDIRRSAERELMNRYEGKLEASDFRPLLAWADLTYTTYQTVLDLLQQEGYPTQIEAWRDMVCQNAETSKHMERCLLERLEEEEFESLPLEDLESLFPMGLCRKDWLTDTLHRLEEEKKVGHHGDRYFRIYPSMYDFIEKETDGKYKYCVMSRLQGNSFDDMAKEMKVTSERARQYMTRFLARVPLVEEMRYMAQKITWGGLSDADFAFIFELSDDTVRFLDYYMDETPGVVSRKERLSMLQSIQEDTNQTEQLRKRAAMRILEIRPALHTEEGDILLNRQALLRHVLHVYGKDGISVQELTNIYNGFLQEKLPKLAEKLYADVWYTEKLSLTMETLASHGRRIRYYDISSRQYDDLLKAFRLEQYQNVEITAGKLFYDYPQLMADYDIRNPYELHNLLKKLQIMEQEKGGHRLPPDMVCGRSPTLLFGHADRYRQVYELLLRKGPMTRPEIAEEMKKEYGIKTTNFISNGWLVPFAKYRKGDVYDISGQ